MTRPTAGPDSLAAAVNAATLQVTPANVLAARTALLTEAQRLDRVVEEKLEQAKVGLCGGDPVSAQAAAAFNERITELTVQCQRYNDELRKAGAELAGIARDYGVTEEQIQATFRTTR